MNLKVSFSFPERKITLKTLIFWREERRRRIKGEGGGVAVEVKEGGVKGKKVKG